MEYLLDTNILIHLLREDEMGKSVEKLLRKTQSPVISVVTIGELKSIALQRMWAAKRIQMLDVLCKRFLIADIHTEEIVNKYAEIDAFSQGKHPNIPLSISARNMGKNDLWIAATASVYDLTLLTTDNDFSHLSETFLTLNILPLS